jgi:hypothetical protein
LKRGLAKSVSEEVQLRHLAWWSRNDRYRSSRFEITSITGIPNEPQAWKANLEALIPLLVEKAKKPGVRKLLWWRAGDGYRLQHAEVLRELGRFEEAKALLKRTKSWDLRTAVTQIRALCDQEDVWVRRLDLGQLPVTSLCGPMPIRERSPK